MNADNTDLVIAHTSSGAEALAKKIRKAEIVSAFGTVPSEVLFSVFEARRKANRPSLVYCGETKKTDENMPIVLKPNRVNDLPLRIVSRASTTRQPSEMLASHG